MQANNEEIKHTLGLDEPKNSKKPWIWYLVIIAIIIAIGSYSTVSSKKRKQLSYKTADVKKSSLTISVSATGNLEPTNTVDVGIEVSGTVTHLYADFNQHVNKGDILLRLDTTKLESRVKNSHAALQIVKANLVERTVALNDSKHELERGNKMLESTKGDYPSDKNMDVLRNSYNRAKANYDATAAGVTQKEAQLKSDENDLKKAVVRAPIKGVVLDKKIDVGQSVVASMQIPILFTLADDLSKMQLILSVDEADIGLVKKGQKVKFSVDAYPEQNFYGVITQVRFNSVIVGGVVTYETVVEVDNSKLLLRPGMTATAEIITKVINETLVVPNAALRFSPEAMEHEASQAKMLWILEDNKPLSIQITTGHSDGIVTSVSGDALKEGMKVILNTIKDN
jgi:HlyD family secretion protein